MGTMAKELNVKNNFSLIGKLIRNYSKKQLKILELKIHSDILNLLEGQVVYFSWQKEE